MLCLTYKFANMRSYVKYRLEVLAMVRCFVSTLVGRHMSPVGKPAPGPSHDLSSHISSIYVQTKYSNKNV